MARTTKRRRRKHRGTQSGSIDSRRRAGRPRSREEARARARKQTSKRGRGESPPTWGGAIGRAAFGAAIFFVLLILIFKRPVGVSALLSVLMLLIYIPFGHAIDGFMYRRRLRAKQREYERRKAGE
jgi:drug/metabolite transporter (DMT)-like permease